METRSLSAILELARRWEVVVPGEMARRVLAFLELLALWNRRLNLTGAADVDELLSEHLVDSFVMCGLCPADANIVDVGSGGGLPAIPFAILRPDCRVTLLEPRAKRVAFLHTAQRAAGCEQVRVVRARAEDVGDTTFSVAMSRATFKPEDWLEVAPRLVGHRGDVLVLAAKRLPERLRLGTLQAEVAYETGRGAARWVGRYRLG